jgi:hypothetical protein
MNCSRADLTALILIFAVLCVDDSPRSRSISHVSSVTGVSEPHTALRHAIWFAAPSFPHPARRPPPTGLPSCRGGLRRWREHFVKGVQLLFTDINMAGMIDGLAPTGQVQDLPRRER